MRLFFVSGPHRSCTTTLGRWLANQEHTTGLAHTGMPEDEGIFLASPPFSVGPDNRPGDFAVQKLNRMENVTADPQDILDKWTPYVVDPNKEWLVEKSPVHCVQHPFLRRTFPDSYHLCVVRHPIPVVASTWKMQQSWGGTLTHEEIAFNWMEAIKTFIEDARGDENTGLLILNKNPRIPENLPFPVSDIPYSARVGLTYFQMRRRWKLPFEVIQYMGQFGFKNVKPYH